ncbi:MAG TPA: UvrD-helicase domain-containing protein [Solirubrobacterales bacterium]|nr:UvrD-helicase domain-containing protein [Solirubrobacterales bacterium]
MSAPRRTEQQREAVRDPRRDVFLRAGAGTGKTTVLVDRFCSAALDPDVGVEHILAFTFTERAADQLRRRVRAELARLASEADGEELERLREAEERTERAWISTIHGFCRRLLASHPAAAGIDPRFRVLDEPESDRLAERAFDAALDGMVSAGDPEALELAASNRRATLLDMTRSAYDELRSQGRPSPALPDPPAADPPARIAELVEAAGVAREACRETTSRLGHVNLERLARAAELDPATELTLDLLEELASLRLEGGGELFRGEECAAYKRALDRTRGAVAGVVMREAYEQLRALVAAFGERYEALKAERSALDFEDLQLQAVALLTGNERLRERYREQFRHLMVDEFQDTNALQLALVRALRGSDTTLFLVGDEFQSIYGFRHADVDVYRSVHARFAGGSERNGVALPLTGNFRAAPELVAATNAIGGALLDGFEPLSAGVAEPTPGAGQPLVELALVADDKSGWEDADVELPLLSDDPSPAPKVAEARLLAGRLRELVDAGEDPAEIVVLLRAFTHVGAVERALTEAGLDPYVVGGRGFWSQQQVEDIRVLLAVVANPLDDEALFGALASPACGVLPDTLWLLRRAATSPPETEEDRERVHHVWPLLRDLLERGAPAEGNGNAEAAARIPAEERERLGAFAEILIGLRRRGTAGGLETLVERVAGAFAYDLATLIRDHGAERWANVRKLMRLAREFESREGPDLTTFLEYLGTRAASRDREAEAATRSEGHAGVRVMTVHAAKGLEFGVVVVADLGRSLQLGWIPLRVEAGAEGLDESESARVGVQLGRLGRPAERLHDYEELTELAADRGAEEEARLAYVAATRAKRRLLLSGTFKPGAKAPADGIVKRKPIAAQLVHALLKGDTSNRVLEVGPAAEGAPPGRIAVRTVVPEPGAGAALLRPRRGTTAAAPGSSAPPPLGRPPVPPALAGGLSYSALSGFERCGYRFYAERVLGISGPEEIAVAPAAGSGDEEGVPADARHRYGPGVAVHALLEWSARNRWRDPGAERAAAALREQGLVPDGLAERVAELVSAWLDAPLRADLDGAVLGAEVPFVLAIGGSLVRGSIDLVARRPDGSVCVVDYKTDRLDGREPASAATRYGVQRDLYALAASAGGIPVQTAYVFLERPGDPVLETFAEDELAAARSRTEAVLERLSAGRFDVTDRPHRALCHDCPARARLCSHGTEAQMRDEPEPPIAPPQSGDEAGDPAQSAPPAAAGANGGTDPQLSLLGE